MIPKYTCVSKLYSYQSIHRGTPHDTRNSEIMCGDNFIWMTYPALIFYEFILCNEGKNLPPFKRAGAKENFEFFCRNYSHSLL